MWRRAILFSVRGVIRLLSKSWNADRLSHTSDNVNEGLESQRPGPSLSCVVAEERILDHLTTPPPTPQPPSPVLAPRGATLKPCCLNAAASQSTSHVGVWQSSVPMQIGEQLGLWSGSWGKGLDAKLWASISRHLSCSARANLTASITGCWMYSPLASLPYRGETATPRTTVSLPEKGVYWPKLGPSDMSGARVCERAAGKDAAKPLRRDRLSAMNGPRRCTGNGGVRVCISAVHHRLHYAFHQGRGVQKLIEGILQGNQPPSLVPLVVLGWPLCRLSKRFGSRCCHKRSLGLIQSCLVTCLGRTSFRRSLWQSQQRRRHGHPGKRSGDELTG